jgi:hypothetical protein
MPDPPGPAKGAGCCSAYGSWYTFSDSDDEGGGESEIVYENLEGEECAELSFARYKSNIFENAALHRQTKSVR